MILVDEGDSVARSGVEGAVNYVTRNKLATVTAQTVVEVQEEEPSQTADKGDVVMITTPASQYTMPVCAALDSMLDSGTPPSLVLDLTTGGVSSEVVKSLSLTLGLPTVTSSQAQDPEDIE